ncbi:MAG TPA: DsbA family protein [Candidatus Dormibacteraeota bacterium]|nr:DsbA family protein [Candidatus Dormibacteraeota bacterium]
MVDPEVIRFEVFYDYFCPFVYRASGLLQNVGRSSAFSLKVTWRYFSLAQVNSKDDGWTAWEAPESEHVSGRMAFRAAEAARRQDAFDQLHMPLLEARHRDRLNIDDVVVIERVAVDAGLDIKRFRADLADATTVDALRRDHMQARSEHGVFGTPTFVFPDGASAYVRLAEAPDAAHAPGVFERLLAIVAGEPSILEIKRPRRPTRE